MDCPKADQQLATGRPPAPLLELWHLLHRGVPPLHQVQLGVQVRSSQQQPGARGEAGIIGVAVNDGDGGAPLRSAR